MRSWLTILLISFCALLSAQNYRIGDVYTAPDGSQGIVYYLFPDGSGGWVVALNNPSDNYKWSTITNVFATGTYAQNYNNSPLQMANNMVNYDTPGYANGFANTQLIRHADNSNGNTYPAAYAVAFDDGWALPSVAQLSMLYAQLPFISGSIISHGGTNLTGYSYWSSTEKNILFLSQDT